MGAWCVSNPSACTDGVRGAFRQPQIASKPSFWPRCGVQRLTWPGWCVGGLLGACASRLLAWMIKKTRGQRAKVASIVAGRPAYAPPSGSTAAVVSDPCASDASATYDDRRASNWASQAEPKNLATIIFLREQPAAGRIQGTQGAWTPPRTGARLRHRKNRTQRCATRPRSSRPRPPRPLC